ncbi:MAG: prepilin peptidase, partial [Planctomycetota bacterium]
QRIEEVQRWQDADHRGLRRGVQWFIACCLLHVLAVAAVAALADDHNASAATAQLLPMWDAAAGVPMVEATAPLQALAPAGAAYLAIEAHLITAILGALTAWWGLYAIGLLGSAVLKRNAMGYGDVKFLAPIGALLGPVGVLYTIGLAALCGAVVGIPWRLLGGGRELPFGPYLALGAVLTAIWGERMHAVLLG